MFRGRVSGCAMLGRLSPCERAETLGTFLSAASGVANRTTSKDITYRHSFESLKSSPPSTQASSFP